MTALPSPLPLVLFAAKKMLRNAARRKLGRLREPRYMVGFLVGAAYFAMIFMRPSRAGRPPAPRLPGHMDEILLVAGAAALAAAAFLAWIFRKGQPSLGLSEAEIQFLFPAPVSRRALLHYALLKAQFPVLLSALILTVVSGRRGSGTAILTGAGLWLLLTAIHFHNLALAFTKARWNELPPGARRATKIAAFAVSASALGILVVTFGAGFSAAASSPLRAGLSLGGLVTALRSGPFGPAPLALLAPFRWILAPLLAPTSRAFILALPAALGLVAVLYACVALTAVRFEEATLSQASRRAALRARRNEGRLDTLPSERRRGTAPFTLAPSGRPEIAVVWKNLLAWNRTSLRRQAAIVTSLAAVLFSASAFLATPWADFAAALGSAACLSLTALLALMTPLGVRIDLRGDLEYATVLRTWPLAPRHLVLAELGAPAAVAVLYGWGGIAIALAIAAGRMVRAAFLGAAVGPPPASAPFARFDALVPVALAVAIFLPALVVAALVVQNASVLAFPAWFPAGRKRAVGLEQAGLRVLSFLGTTLVLGLAFIPSALLAGPLIFFTIRPLGLWCLPLAALLAALPVLAEAVAGVFLLARLLERFDPSRDAGS
ncbi:MAG TPA: putative ABC exporter domain-containing protein [Thermoanaerobaculia bacterium]|nr:putative ABC exporter domain-containing protein [Thermoanaerobaculia bacterium]